MGLWGFLTTSHEEILAIANVFIAIGTIIVAFGVPLAINDAGREQRDTFYATLDRTYFEIQKLIIENPHLNQTDLTGKSADQVVQYDAFAFIVWNFVESIFDYSRQEKMLAVTWECILEFESIKHDEWFWRAENQPKFKDAFVQEMKLRKERRLHASDKLKK